MCAGPGTNRLDPDHTLSGSEYIDTLAFDPRLLCFTLGLNVIRIALRRALCALDPADGRPRLPSPSALPRLPSPKAESAALPAAPSAPLAAFPAALAAPLAAPAAAPAAPAVAPPAAPAAPAAAPAASPPRLRLPPQLHHPLRRQHLPRAKGRDGAKARVRPAEIMSLRVYGTGEDKYSHHASVRAHHAAGPHGINHVAAAVFVYAPTFPRL